MSALAWSPADIGYAGCRGAASPAPRRPPRRRRAGSPRPAASASPAAVAWRCSRSPSPSSRVLGLVGMRGAGAAEPPRTVTVERGADPVRGGRSPSCPSMSISEGILAIQLANQMSTAQVSAGQRARHPAVLTARPAPSAGGRAGPTVLSPSTRLRTPKGVAPVQGSDALRAVRVGRLRGTAGSTLMRRRPARAESLDSGDDAGRGAARGSRPAAWPRLADRPSRSSASSGTSGRHRDAHVLGATPPASRCRRPRRRRRRCRRRPRTQPLPGASGSRRGKPVAA